MFTRPAVTLVAILLATNLAGAAPRAGDAGVDPARRALVVATVGAEAATRTVTVAEVEDGLASMPPFQRATFGHTSETIRHEFLAEVLLREAWLSLGAQGAKLAETPTVSYAVERAFSSATIRAIRGAAGTPSAIPMSDVATYYEQNRDRYDSPERIQLWRILCKTRDEAQSVLDAALATPNTISSSTSFGQLARDHSVDKATALRGGDLGFLAADGTSIEPGLRVDPSILTAARGVRDGELVRAPLPEGAYFAVVWRRGTMPEVKRTVQSVAAQIRDTLWRARIKDETDRLLATLRGSRVRDRNDALLDAVELPPENDR